MVKQSLFVAVVIFFFLNESIQKIIDFLHFVLLQNVNLTSSDTKPLIAFLNDELDLKNEHRPKCFN